MYHLWLGKGLRKYCDFDFKRSVQQDSFGVLAVIDSGEFFFLKFLKRIAPQIFDKI
jgi:hypothetical protein